MIFAPGNAETKQKIKENGIYQFSLKVWV